MAFMKEEKFDPWILHRRVREKRLYAYGAIMQEAFFFFQSTEGVHRE